MSSVATLPVARGANGQPPRPPTDASRTAAPASTAAHAQATPVWRVSWKCPPTGTPRIETRSTRCLPGRGVATRMVSARTISPAPAATSRSAMSATTPASTSPSNGQPNEQLIVALVGRSATPRIRSTRTAASSSDAFPFRWLKDSVAAKVTVTRSSPVAASRSQPRSLSTSPESSASTSPTAATTSSAPAICGTRSGLTKLTASIRGSPAAASRRTSSARVSCASVPGSFWSPSRGPTSQRVTRIRRSVASRSSSAVLLVLERLERVQLRRPASREDRGDDPDDHGQDRKRDDLRRRQRELDEVDARDQERAEHDAEDDPQRPADQGGDHALVPDHPPHLAPRHPDRAQHPELSRALEDCEHERVHDPEEADDHRQREQHVEDVQHLVERRDLVVDELVARLHLRVRELRAERVLECLRVRVRVVAAHLDERVEVAWRVVDAVERPARERDGAEGRPARRRIEDALHRQLEPIPGGDDHRDRRADAEIVVLGVAIVDERAVRTELAEDGLRAVDPIERYHLA